MNKTEIVNNDTLIECAICLKEIPESEAKSFEAQDYLQYYCGLDCYQQWQNQIENKPDQD